MLQVQPPSARDDRRQTWQGLGDGLSQAFEMAVTPVLFTLLGVFIDRRLETAPVFAVALAVFAVVGTFVKAYYVYRYRSEQEEARRAWVRPPR